MACSNSAIINYRSTLLFSGPYSENNRHNLTVLASDDSGASFSRSLVLVPGTAGYSSLACGFNNTFSRVSPDCGVLYKASKSVRFVRFHSGDIGN